MFSTANPALSPIIKNAPTPLIGQILARMLTTDGLPALCYTRQRPDGSTETVVAAAAPHEVFHSHSLMSVMAALMPRADREAAFADASRQRGITELGASLGMTPALLVEAKAAIRDGHNAAGWGGTEMNPNSVQAELTDLERSSAKTAIVLAAITGDQLAIELLAQLDEVDSPSNGPDPGDEDDSSYRQAAPLPFDVSDTEPTFRIARTV